MEINDIKLPPDIYEQLDIVVDPSNARHSTRGNPLTKDEIVGILKMWASGMTHQQIADARGIKKIRIRNCFANKMLDVSEVRKMRYKHRVYNGIRKSNG
jgi:hypothetical protein